MAHARRGRRRPPLSAKLRLPRVRVGQRGALYLVNGALAAVVVAVNASLWWPGQGYWRVQRMTEQRDELQRLNARQATLNAGLQAEIDSLQHGMDAVEDRARGSLGMIREGETLYRLIEPQR